jgi:ferredoxin
MRERPPAATPLTASATTTETSSATATETPPAPTAETPSTTNGSPADADAAVRGCRGAGRRRRRPRMIAAALSEHGTDGRARAVALAGLRLAEVAPAAVVEFVSRGRCLVVGDEAAALTFARALGSQLECFVLVPGGGMPDVDVVDGIRIVRGGRPLVRGALGDFAVTLVTDAAPVELGGLLSPADPRLDLVVDLGAAPLLRQAMPPLGYYAPGPDDDARAALLESLPEMRGAFEKPAYVRYDPDACAHGRSGKRGCTRCLPVCPAEAIVSIGDRIQVNPYLCQGGGACATACPTNALTYTFPGPTDLLRGVQRLLREYRAAGGAAPVLMFHDASAVPALDDGLGATMPERVLPVVVEEIGSVGLETWFACLAYGAEAVVMLSSDRTPGQVIETLQEQLVVARAILEGMGQPDRLRLLNADQPALAQRELAAAPAGTAPPPATFLVPTPDKRGTLRLALQHLQAQAPPGARTVTPLPAGAPFGEVRVDGAACTLCMSCVSSCPTHALQDGRDVPRIDFREWNCVQCGLCERTCPEGAISLGARFLHDLPARERPRTLHEEAPVCCVSCGRPFATRSTLDKLGQKLAGHWMFQTEEARARLQMCGDCRVRDLHTAEARRVR